MNRVETPAHFELLLMDARSRQGQQGRVSHCYLLANEVSRLCDQGLLFYENQDAGLLLFNVRGRDVLLSMVVCPETPIDDRVFSRFGRPVRCEFPSRGGRYPPDVASLMGMLKKCGFAPEASATRMAMVPLPAIRDQILSHRHPGSITVEPAGAELADDIMSLWEETFDCAANGVPTRDELIPLLRLGRVIYAQGGDSRLAGALLSEFCDRCGWVWHVAVGAEFRGMGIGRALMSEYHKTGLGRPEPVRAFRLWVSDKDLGAEAFHTKLGYRPDGRESVSFIHLASRK